MSDSEDEHEFRDDSSDDVPMSSLRNGGSAGDTPNSKRRRSQVNYAENDNDDEELDDDNGNDDDDDNDEGEDNDDDDDDDDEDDVPLSALASPSPKKKKKTPSKETNGKTKKKGDAAPAKKKKPAAKKKTASSAASVSSATKSTSNSTTDFKSPSAALYGSDCEKGQLIQRLLCRWWYAMEWPDPAAIPAQPPKHYDPLDGFPGVYVCTAGDDVGVIKDFRDKGTCPNFNNMAKKSSEELQTLLIKALKEQQRQLIEAEGTGTETQKELDNLIKWASKIKPSAADKAAEKVLKAAKLSLD